jgi:hypothetical protein
MSIADELDAPWLQREKAIARKRAEKEKNEEEALDQRRERQRADSMTQSLERIAKLTGAPAPEAGLERFVAFKDPQAARAQDQERQQADAERRELLERSLEQVRAELGEWTKDSGERLQKLEQTAKSEPDAKQLGTRGWALGRLTATGSTHDLAYALSQMLLEVPPETLGCWVIQAMGLTVDGRCTRQLYAPNARRKLARSYILFRCGRVGRLCEFAGSPSRRLVHGTVRCPQTLIARVCALGGKPWSRATTTRDATESHNAGLYRRVRLPKDVAHESERAGPSGEVVSRYWSEIPNQRRQARASRTSTLANVLGNTSEVRTATVEWVRSIARHACQMAVSALGQTQCKRLQLAWIPGLMEPRLAVATAPPTP